MMTISIWTWESFLTCWSPRGREDRRFRLEIWTALLVTVIICWTVINKLLIPELFTEPYRACKRKGEIDSFRGNVTGAMGPYKLAIAWVCLCCKLHFWYGWSMSDLNHLTGCYEWWCSWPLCHNTIVIWAIGKDNSSRIDSLARSNKPSSVTFRPTLASAAS